MWLILKLTTAFQVNLFLKVRVILLQQENMEINEDMQHKTKCVFFQSIFLMVSPANSNAYQHGSE